MHLCPTDRTLRRITYVAFKRFDAFYLSSHTQRLRAALKQSVSVKLIFKSALKAEKLNIPAAPSVAVHFILRPQKRSVCKVQLILSATDGLT